MALEQTRQLRGGPASKPTRTVAETHARADTSAAAQARPTRPLRGILSPPPIGEFEHLRVAPSASLADSVEHFWYVRWRCHEHPQQTVATLPHPCVHWTFERDAAHIGGVHTRLWQRALGEAGEVFGIKFRPAGFRGLWGSPLHGLTDRRFDAEAQPVLAFGRALRAQVFAFAAGTEVEARIEMLQQCLRAHLPQPSSSALTVNTMVDAACEDRSLLRAEDWAQRHGLNIRSLQRLLRDWVGVGPKWIIARYRLHEALAVLQAAPHTDLSALAAELGYADAAHFSREFKRLLGLSPSALRRRTSAP